MEAARPALVKAPRFLVDAPAVNAPAAKRLLREPLVHFLAIGAALFLAFAGTGGGASGRIVVTRARIHSLAAGFRRTWERPPTTREMQGLIDGFVREEAAVREAMATGLDRDDSVVRRRLRQKLESLAEETADATPAPDPAVAADLRKRELDALYARLLAKTTVVIENAPEKK